MKRRISLLLVACIILTSLMTLNSCFHFCKFSEEWTHDGENHWHACTNPDCDKVEGLEQHSFDAGRITRKPTQEEDGVNTLTCTVCGGTKELTVLFNGLDWTDWNAAFSEASFANFTYQETAKASNSGITVVTTAIYKFTESEVFASMTVGGNTTSDTVSGLTAAATKKQMIESIQKMLEFGNFTYSRETKSYTLTGTMKITNVGNAKTATLTFKDGKPYQLIYTCTVYSNGIAMDCESTITFSDFGTTVID